jgi:hypothetical protein
MRSGHALCDPDSDLLYDLSEWTTRLVDERDVQRLSRDNRETQQVQLLANAREWDRYSTPERHVIVRSATAARLGVRRDLVLRY